MTDDGPYRTSASPPPARFGSVRPWVGTVASSVDSSMRRAVVVATRATTGVTTRTEASTSSMRAMATAIVASARGETRTTRTTEGARARGTVVKAAPTRRQAMEVTPSASRRIKELLRARNKEYLKIGVKTRGCNGMTYTMNYAEEGERKKFDELVETEDGVKIIVEPNALMSIIGTKMDYVSDRLRSEFVFENPNAKAECGCGESFTV
jgi:iron-sulfur cluster assembly accessory protein